ncbi:predicted protein, partial [Nematostella vectensis]
MHTSSPPQSHPLGDAYLQPPTIPSLRGCVPPAPHNPIPLGMHTSSPPQSH